MNRMREIDLRTAGWRRVMLALTVGCCGSYLATKRHGLRAQCCRPRRQHSAAGLQFVCGGLQDAADACAG
jgi:hypothetical protein